MTFQTAVGAILALIAGVIFNVFPLMQKSVLNKMPDMKGNLLASYLSLAKSPKYVGSIVLMFGGGYLYFISLKFTGLAVVTPLMAFGMLALVFGAKKYLNESLALPAKAAIGMLIIMPVFIALGDVAGPQQVNDMGELINWLCWGSGLFIVLFFMSIYFPIIWPINIGFMITLGTMCLQAFTLSFDFNNIFDNMLQNFLLLTGTIAFSLVGQLLLVPLGLQKLKATVFIPVMGTVGNLATIFVGIVIYRQVVGRIEFYAIGILFGLISIIVLGKFQSGPEQPQN